MCNVSSLSSAQAINTSIPIDNSVKQPIANLQQIKATSHIQPPQKPLPTPPQKKVELTQTSKPETGPSVETKRSEVKNESIPENNTSSPLIPGMEGTTITKEISSRHPHLDEATNKAVQAYFNPEPKTVNKEVSEKFINQLKESGIIKENGKIKFPTNLSTGVKGKVFINEKGEFDFKISGKCCKGAQEQMQWFKDQLDGIKNDNNNEFKEIPININPAAVGPLSDGDKTALANGGQIQYRALPDGSTMKLTLDPGRDGIKDGLKIDIYDTAGNIKATTKDPIPLEVVFEGQAFNGNKGVGPFLGNWRVGQYFERSVIHEERRLTGGLRQTNEGDVNRIRAQSDLWDAVNKYLKASVDQIDGKLSVNNEISDGQEVANSNNEEINGTSSNQGQESGEKSVITGLEGDYSVSYDNLANGIALNVGGEVKINDGSQQANPESGVTLDSGQQISFQEIHTMENQEQVAELNNVNEGNNGITNLPDGMSIQLKQLEKPLLEIATAITKLKDAGFEGIKKFELEYREIKGTIKACAKTPKKHDPSFFKQLLKNAQELVEEINKITQDQEISATDVAPSFKFENGESTIKNAGVRAKARAPQKKSERHGDLLDAAKKMADYMQNIVSALPEDDSQEMQTTKMVESPEMKINNEETQEQYAVIGDTTKGNPGKKLLEKGGVALITQLNVIQQDLDMNWVFNKKHGLTNQDAFKQEIARFNENVKETYNDEKSYWGNFTTWYAEKNGGSPVV